MTLQERYIWTSKKAFDKIKQEEFLKELQSAGIGHNLTARIRLACKQKTSVTQRVSF